jgi:hypothetical protein
MELVRLRGGEEGPEPMTYACPWGTKPVTRPRDLKSFLDPEGKNGMTLVTVQVLILTKDKNNSLCES